MIWMKYLEVNIKVFKFCYFFKLAIGSASVENKLKYSKKSEMNASIRVHSRFGTLFTISQPLHEISLDVFTLLAIDWENLMKRIVIGSLD